MKDWNRNKILKIKKKKISVKSYKHFYELLKLKFSQHHKIFKRIIMIYPQPIFSILLLFKDHLS